MAGTVSAVTQGMGGVVGPNDRYVYEFSYTFVADAADGSIPSQTLPKDRISGGMIVGVGADFLSPAPSGLVVTLKDSHGITLYATSSFSADGTDTPVPFVAFTGTITVSLSGNSTNEAQGKVVVRVAPV